MGRYGRLWWMLFAVVFVYCLFQAWMGVAVNRQVPPIPERFVTPNETVITTKTQILDGQSGWQSTGGMQIGSIWGYGAYQAPDWTADWLHRELLAWLDLAAQENYGMRYDELEASQQVMLEAQLKVEYRTNTLDPETHVLTV